MRLGGLLTLLITSCCFAQDVTPPAPATVLERLFFAHETPESLELAIASAEQENVPLQNILEARFIYHVDRQDDEAVAAMADSLQRLEATFDPAISQTFALRSDFLAVSSYSQALAALEENDDAAFKKHITEAFWHSPDQANLLGEHVKRLKLKRAMENISIPMGIEMRELSGAKDVAKKSLRSHFGDETRALLLFFWSPWALDADVTLSDLEPLAQSLAASQIPTSTILLRPEGDTITDAIALRSANADSAPVTWLVDGREQSLARLLQISPIPSVVLLSPKGAVLYNGEPDDEEFWQTLQKIAPDFQRPERG